MAMLQQEQTPFYSTHQRRHCYWNTTESSSHPMDSSSPRRKPKSGPLHCRHAEPPVDAACREQMGKWFVQMVQSCRFQNETAEIAMDLLDRFVSTPEGDAARVDRTLYQLASMTAFYTAVKVHETMTIDPKLISRLSRNMFSVQDVTRMETTMLRALQWRVHPPTAMSFLRLLVATMSPATLLWDMTHQGDDDEAAATAAAAASVVMEMAELQTMLATTVSTKCQTIPRSQIALCALWNAIETVRADNDWDDDSQQQHQVAGTIDTWMSLYIKALYRTEESSSSAAATTTTRELTDMGWVMSTKQALYEIIMDHDDVDRFQPSCHTWNETKCIGSTLPTENNSSPRTTAAWSRC